jgi:hypothetical protein
MFRKIALAEPRLEQIIALTLRARISESCIGRGARLSDLFFSTWVLR